MSARESTMSILRLSIFTVVAAVPAAHFSKMQAARLPLQKQKNSAFTVLELLVVIAIIIVLAGLILATTGYVQNKGARSRAEAEIAAMSAALESYKADNGIYPTDATATANINPTASPTPAAACLFLYQELSGDRDKNRVIDANAKSYFSFKPNQLSPTDQTQPVAFIRDPFGNSYGYSTAKSANPAGPVGFNPTFDLWSTANSGDPAAWVKNW